MNVVGVRFENVGKMYFFDPMDYQVEPGMRVVVETAKGVELGEVVSPVRDLPEEKVIKPLKPILRVATKADMDNHARNQQRVAEAGPIFIQKVEQHKLEMKLVDVEYAFDGTKIIFYFTANGRVDFRELVKDLASVFHMRIELRQIGVRDEAKMLGGLGPCGRPNCCGVFLHDFQSVSIKMAKEQNLSLNPIKISGLCGRLMCCLNYEQEFYETTRKRMPRLGKEVITPDGNGTVIEINALRETVKVRVQNQSERGFEIRDYPADQVRRLHPPNQGASAKTDESEEEMPDELLDLPEDALLADADFPRADNVRQSGGAPEKRENDARKPFHKRAETGRGQGQNNGQPPRRTPKPDAHSPHPNNGRGQPEND